jgi:hypothetical protein
VNETRDLPACSIVALILCLLCCIRCVRLVHSYSSLALNGTLLLCIHRALRGYPSTFSRCDINRKLRPPSHHAHSSSNWTNTTGAVLNQWNIYPHLSPGTCVDTAPRVNFHKVRHCCRYFSSRHVELSPENLKEYYLAISLRRGAWPTVI